MRNGVDKTVNILCTINQPGRIAQFSTNKCWFYLFTKCRNTCDCLSRVYQFCWDSSMIGSLMAWVSTPPNGKAGQSGQEKRETTPAHTECTLMCCQICLVTATVRNWYCSTSCRHYTDLTRAKGTGMYLLT